MAHQVSRDQKVERFSNVLRMKMARLLKKGGAFSLISQSLQKMPKDQLAEILSARSGKEDAIIFTINKAFPSSVDKLLEMPGLCDSESLKTIGAAKNKFGSPFAYECMKDMR